MVARRLASLFVALLMLHLSFISADIACAKHGDARTASSSGHAAAMPPTHQSGVRGNDDGSPPCEIPVQATCCGLLASCNASQAFVRTSTPDDRLPRRSVIASSTMRLPTSPIASPDPPPPKL